MTGPAQDPQVVLNPRPARLRLSTDMHQDYMQEVSMLPTPLVTQNPTFVAPGPSPVPAGPGSSPPSLSLASPDPSPRRLAQVSPVSAPAGNRIVSMSVVPEHVPKMLASDDGQLPLVHGYGPHYGSPADAEESLVIPKRGEIRLGRSGSVGTRRMPTTVLHREPPPLAGLELELPPESEEYITEDGSGHESVWKRLKFLGKGSFSEVVLARSPLSGKLAAVKITHLGAPTRADHQTQLQSLDRDAELLRDLPPHPALMHMLAWSLTPDRAIFVLPYCPGGDLFDLVARNRSRMIPGLVRRIFGDIVSAVAFLHAHNVVHRDIKLENVLLDVDVEQLLGMTRPEQYTGSVAVLTDLGLARRIDPENPLLTTRCGSEDYVPPELLVGQPYDGRQTDSWALGVLLYAVLEGRLPFDPPPVDAIGASGAAHARARLRTAHRIARVDWSWYRRQESSPEWDGAKGCVEAVLRRRQHRASAEDLLRMPWLQGASPGIPDVTSTTSDQVKLMNTPLI